MGRSGSESGVGSPPSTPPVYPLLFELACQRFFYDYVFHPDLPRGRGGYLEWLPQLSATWADRPVFMSALKASAFANFAERCHSESASKEAIREYGKAIKLTNAALKNPGLVFKDETLLACHLLGISEVGHFPS